MPKTTTDVTEWLGKLGLNQYAQAFTDNHIDYSVLPDLTENDLQKLGVSLGHGKRLLRAIETLKIESQPSSDNTADLEPRCDFAGCRAASRS